MSLGALGGSLATGMLAISVVLGVGIPSAHAKNGDTHVTGQGVNQTVDCGGATVIVDGTSNYVTVVGDCWAVTVQGSYNIVVADNVVNDITVYGFNQTVLYHNGDPAVIDRGRELGMTNRIDRVAA